jgi:hypothetical protein
MLFDLTFPCYLTTFSGEKCLSGKFICAFFCPAYRNSPVYKDITEEDQITSYNNVRLFRRYKYSIPPFKRWGSVGKLTFQLQKCTPDGIRFSHKPTGRRRPRIPDTTDKESPLKREPLKGGECCIIQ